MAKMAEKRSEAESIVGQVLSERTKSKVIAPYAETCASLSKPPICNTDGIASSGIWVSKTTIAVKRTATISHLGLKYGLGFSIQKSAVGEFSYQLVHCGKLMFLAKPLELRQV